MAVTDGLILKAVIDVKATQTLTTANALVRFVAMLPGRGTRLLLLSGVLTTTVCVASSSTPTSAATITINAPLARVWQLMADIGNWPKWNPAVESAKLDGSLSRGSTFRWENNGFDVTSTLQTIEPMHRLIWTGKAFGTTAVHSWEFQSSAAGVVVRTSETFGGWLPWLMPDKMQHSLDETLPEWLQNLKAAAERPK